MAKGRSLDIESHRHGIGSALLFQAKKDIKKSVNRVCESAVLGREDFDAVKSSVKNTVAVDNKKIHA